MFNAEVTPLNATGYGVCMFGVIGYNALKMHRAKEEKGPYAVCAPPSLFLLLPLSLSNSLTHSLTHSHTHSSCTALRKRRGPM
eukprot:1722597-Rhodomonas_salina.1